MIITAGKYKGRKLKIPKGDTVRSSTALLKESLFNIIQEEIYNSIFLDIFAGSGSVGIEALSRGAKFAYFIEKNRLNCSVIKNNLNLVSAEDKSKVINSPVEKFLSRNMLDQPVDIVFLDPPYDIAKPEYIKNIFNQIVQNNFLADNGVIILEFPAYDSAEQFNIASLQFIKEKKYGISGLGFWSIKTD